MSTSAAATAPRSAPHLLKLLGIVFGLAVGIGTITLGLLATAVPVWFLTARFRAKAPAA